MATGAKERDVALGEGGGMATGASTHDARGGRGGGVGVAVVDGIRGGKPSAAIFRTALKVPIETSVTGDALRPVSPVGPRGRTGGGKKVSISATPSQFVSLLEGDMGPSKMLASSPTAGAAATTRTVRRRSSTEELERELEVAREEIEFLRRELDGSPFSARASVQRLPPLGSASGCSVEGGGVDGDNRAEANDQSLSMAALELHDLVSNTGSGASTVRSDDTTPEGTTPRVTAVKGTTMPPWHRVGWQGTVMSPNSIAPEHVTSCCLASSDI